MENSRHTGQRREAASQDGAILVVFLLNVATLPHQVPALLPPSRALRNSRSACSHEAPESRGSAAAAVPAAAGDTPWGSCEGPVLPSPGSGPR